MIRARESIDLTEEYAKVNVPATVTTSDGHGAAGMMGPALPQNEWLIYDDAKKWAKLIRDSLDGLRKSMSNLTMSTLDTQNQLAIMAKNMHQVLDNTQHAGGSAISAVPKTLESLVEPHSDLVRRRSTGSGRSVLLIRQCVHHDGRLNS